MLEVKTLGELSTQLNGESITCLPSRKAEALLVYLAVENGSPIRRESLFTLLWPGMPEKSARHNLRQVLYALRKSFGEVAVKDGDQSVPLLLADRHTVQINPEAAVDVDVHQLDRNLEETQLHEHLNLTGCETCLQALEGVVDLYAGEFLHDFYLEDSNPFEDWVAANREAYRSKVLEILETLSEIFIQKGEYDSARTYADQQLKIDPLREIAYRQLMEILAQNGQRTAALQQYRTCEKILKDELGVAPSTKTILLHEQIRTESLPPPEADLTAQPHSTPLHNLPHPLTSFIGRQQEIEEITQQIRHHRLVTLTGTGGIGKTQLELQIGRRSLEAFGDGIWLVELAPISDPQLVPQTAAFALGLWESPNRPIMEQLIEYLQDKHCLLILDNCEHLIDAAAQFTETILQTCPEVKMLASSREALDIPGEIPFLVQPLSFPDVHQALALADWERYDAVRLFVERAAAGLPDFQVTQENLLPLVKICQRLDGIPLALELAAARVKILPLEEIAARLDDRFHLLTESSRTAPERQQTLRASIQWSWELLSTEEQTLMQHLSVFAGGMNLEAVEAVCGSDGIDPGKVLDLMTQLINKSMLIAQREQGQETRYQLLETIRQYAQEQLAAAGLEEKYRDRHLDYFMKLAEQAEDALVGPDQAACLNQLDRELDNIRAALSWARETDIKAGLRLSTALWQFWEFNYISEGIAWIKELLALADKVEPAIRAKALWVQGRSSQGLHNRDRIQSLVKESLALYQSLGDQQGVARCLCLLGSLSGYMYEPALLLESISLFRASGDKLGLAQALGGLGNCVCKDNYKQALVYLTESKLLYQELGHIAGMITTQSGIMQAAIWQEDFELARSMLEEFLNYQDSPWLGRIGLPLTSIGDLYFRLQDYDQARVYYEKSLSDLQHFRNEFPHAWTSVRLGYVFLRMSEFSKAQTIFTKCQQQFKEVDNTCGVIFSTEGLAFLALSQGQAQKAAQLFGWADATRQATQDIRPPVEQKDVDRDTSTIIEMIGEEAYSAAYAEGQAMTMEQAIALTIGNEFH